MLKAIETHYAGCRFRSRTEARWAVFLDALGLKWEYEREGFELPSGRYLPDFWIPEWGVWMEVKGGEPTEAEQTLTYELAEATNCPCVIAKGIPEQGAFQFEACLLLKLRLVEDRNGFVLASDLGDFEFMIPVPRRPLDDAFVKGRMTKRLENAFNKARSARFEFGEKGGK